MKGLLLAKGPDSSLGEVRRGSCSDNTHMEEEKVEVKVQEDEVENGRDKVQSEGRRETRHSRRRMTHGWDDAHKHLSQCRVRHHYECAQNTRKR